MAQTSEQNVTESATEQFPPAIAAAFLVIFDNRKGYTIAWQNAIDDVKLDGVVEFKSLPSGLHNVEEDLVYFVHDNYAGISAFLRKDDEQAARNARMLSVGVLVPIEAGRMGKSFLYARELRDLARNLIDDQATITPLEKFWDKHKKAQVDEQHDTEEPEPREKYQKLRTLSTTTLTTPTPNRCLPPHHPALALPDLLHAFGPLIFPVFRAALLRKRILIIGEAPVEPICDFVYCLSILSSISRTDAAQIPESDVSKFRTRPLFTIGIPDIPMLENVDYPWIACTTDDVLASKPHLFDVLVIMPNSPVSQKYSSRTYPKVISSSPELAKEFPHHGQRATRRDARRFSALKVALARIPRGSSPVDTEQRQDDSDSMSTNSSVSTIADSRETVEPTPWSVIAYTSLIWWASAGDRRSGLMEAEELANEQDESLLREALSEEGTTKEVAMVIYFHKLTSMVFSALGNAARRNGGDEQERYRDDDSDESEAEDRALLSSKDDDNQIPVEVTEEDVRAMGLDVWSAMDQKFVQEMIQTYWHRPAVVQGGIIECCGIRLL